MKNHHTLGFHIFDRKSQIKGTSIIGGATINDSAINLITYGGRTKRKRLKEAVGLTQAQVTLGQIRNDSYR